MEDGPRLLMGSLKTVAQLSSQGASYAAPLAGPIGSGIGMVCDSVVDGIDAYDSQQTVAKLKEIARRNMYYLAAKKSKHLEPLWQVLNIALEKKRRHRDIAIAGAASVQVAKPFTQLYRAGRAVQKSFAGTKGVSREYAADCLIAALNDSQDTLAQQVAREIVSAIAHRNFEDLLKHSLTEALRS